MTLLFESCLQYFQASLVNRPSLDFTSTVLFLLSDPPTFLDPLKDQVFNLRRDGKLECRVNGIPYPTVTFKKDWRMIADSHRIKVRFPIGSDFYTFGDC